MDLAKVLLIRHIGLFHLGHAESKPKISAFCAMRDEASPFLTYQAAATCWTWQRFSGGSRPAVGWGSAKSPSIFRAYLLRDALDRELAGRIAGRLMGQWLSERFGRPFVVENRPGAGGALLDRHRCTRILAHGGSR
jgi:hypothetical protein